jgi:hypothetical protein
MLQRLERFLRHQALLGLGSFLDVRLYAALGIGFSAWLLPAPASVVPWTKLALFALYEEIVFRMLLQEGLHSLLRRRFLAGGLSLANAGASLVFALAHLVHHPPGWALAVLLPSLVFGWAWDRYKSLLPCTLLHFVYNFLFFYRVY